MNKSTGIKWLGTIPSSWNVCRVKDIFEISKEKSKEKNPVILSLARDSIKVRDISTNEGQLAASYEGYNPVKKGDLLLNPMDLYSGANCNVSNVEGVISPAYSKLRAKAKINPCFYDYYFKVQYWTMAMFAHGKGVSFDNRWTLNNDTLRAYELPLPSYEEQNKIVETIRNKESKINALLANEEQQIQKLQQYKQAVIAKIVTKGLDEKAQLKDSGISWIGQIPERWKVIRVKDCFSVFTGSTPDSSTPGYYDGDIIWITPSDFKTADKFVEKGKRNLTESGFHSCSTTIIPPGSLVISKRAPIGNVAITKKELCTNQGCLSCVSKSNLDIRYFYYYFSTKSDILNVLGNGTTFKEISFNSFNNLYVPFPTSQEQKSISQCLDEETTKIDSLISVKNEMIQKLIKFKKSMIYEYVTGKKEVE